MINEIFQDAEKKFNAAVDYFRSELSLIRSERVSPALVEELSIEAYEDSYQLKELAAISSPEPNLIVIQPWDQGVIEAVERALLQADLGAVPSVDGSIIRLNIPGLSEQRREKLMRKVGEKAEQARISIRNIRQEKMKALDDLEDKGKISEDEHERFRQQIQELVDDSNQQIAKLKETKTQALSR